MDDVRVLDDPVEVEAALGSARAVILDALTEPRSASSVAEVVGLTRQKVNYHLKVLEEHGLVELAEERSWGGITERILRRTASRLLVSPSIIQPSVSDPEAVADRLSAGYLLAVSARTVSEVGALAGSVPAGTRLPTLSVDTTIGFASAEDRAAFAADLQAAVAAVAARYHVDGGRPYRVTVASYPRPKETP